MKFNAEKHEYSKDGVVYTSATQLLQQQGLAPEYSKVPVHILEQAKARGKRIHEEIENYFKGEIEEVSEDTLPYIEALKDKGFVIIDNECRVYDENYKIAGTIDIVGMLDDELVLIDTKTTYEFQENYVSWQLSLYKHMFQVLFKETPRKLFCLWRSEIIEVEELPVEYLLECHKSGQRMLAVVENHAVDLRALDETIKDLTDQKKLIQDAIKDYMKINNIKSFENEYVKVSYVAPFQRVSFDYKKLLEIKGVEYSQEELELVKKISNVRESVRITHRTPKEVE